jgi:hypothetical protein
MFAAFAGIFRASRTGAFSALVAFAHGAVFAAFAGIFRASRAGAFSALIAFAHRAMFAAFAGVFRATHAGAFSALAGIANPIIICINKIITFTVVVGVHEIPATFVHAHFVFAMFAHFAGLVFLSDQIR